MAVPKRKVKKLADVLKECCIAEPDQETPRGTVLNKAEDPELMSKWPKVKQTVPHIFLHNSKSQGEHMIKLLEIWKDANFYATHKDQFQDIKVKSLSVYKFVIQFMDQNKMPYHTYGLPSKRKWKIVIRGLPNDTNILDVKQELKDLSLPVIRIHKMKTGQSKMCPFLVLVVVPAGDESKRIFALKKVLGHDVKLEPPKPKTKQCYRCQKWGHSQRYCHGAITCVKCAGNHISKKCPRKSTDEPVKCANCGGDHTANYRECNYCPDSKVHKMTTEQKKIKRLERELFRKALVL